MRLAWIAGLVGIVSATVIMRPDIAGTLLQRAYPSSPAQRYALDRCALEDTNFDRLDPAAREACYRRSPLAHHAAAAPNFVDQWHDAGQGRLPRNDIRVEQRGERYLRAAASGR